MKEEWKVYIKGVRGRGNEVIKVLEDIGDINSCRYTGEKEEDTHVTPYVVQGSTFVSQARITSIAAKPNHGGLDMPHCPSTSLMKET